MRWCEKRFLMDEIWFWNFIGLKGCVIKDLKNSRVAWLACSLLSANNHPSDLLFNV